MKKIVSMGLILTISVFSLAGCGSHSDYVTQVNNSNTQMMELWKTAEISRVKENGLQLQAFGLAMNNAAKTPDSGDDVAIAMSYAYMSQQKHIDLPKLSRVERPNDFVDGLKATIPLLSIIAPWWGMAYITDSVVSNAGTHYNIGGSDNNLGSSIYGSYSPVTGAEGSTSFAPTISSPTTTEVVPVP